MKYNIKQTKNFHLHVYDIANMPRIYASDNSEKRYSFTLLFVTIDPKPLLGGALNWISGAKNTEIR